MSDPLDLLRCGAVTAVGLSAAQTAAAIRARVSGVADVHPLAPPKPAQKGARVPATHALRRRPERWLVNLAARAARECLGTADPSRTALLLSIPEAHRRHPGVDEADPARLLRDTSAKLGVAFHPGSRVFREGHAAVFLALATARELLAGREVDACIVGGVDSQLNPADVARLGAAFRLSDADEPQGMVPGEGAGFVLAARAEGPTRPLARLIGLGFASEADAILGARYSQGRGLCAALAAAIRDAGVPEASLRWRVSDMNGERYRAWESLLTEFRFYRTRRESFSPLYFAPCVGDLGAAAGAIALVTALAGIARGWAPGPRVACEASSDEGLRGAAILESLPGAAPPPFRGGSAWPEGMAALS